MHTKIFILLLLPSILAAIVPRGVPLNDRQWNEITKYVDNRASPHFETGQSYLSPSNTGLACPVAYNPLSKLIFIHFEDCKLGEGAHKSAYLSFLYNASPRLVARCISDETGYSEAKILSMFKGVNGIIQLVDLFIKSESKCELYLEFCNLGTLKDVETKKIKLSNKDRLAIANDLIFAVNAIHMKGFVHRDLHEGNILLHQDLDGRICAFVSDFGHALPITTELHEPIAISRSGCPPEALLRPFNAINRTLGEAYAVGIALYVVLFAEKPSWSKLFDYITKYNKSQALKIYDEIGRRWLESKKRRGKTPLGALVHGLLNPNVKKRLSLPDALRQIGAIKQNSG